MGLITVTMPLQRKLYYCNHGVTDRHIIKHNIAESFFAFPLLEVISIKNLVYLMILKLKLLIIVYLLRIIIKMNYEEIIKISHILKENDNPFVKFFTQTSLHIQLLSIFSLNFREKRKDNFEKILTKINKRLGSRSTLLKTLKDGVELGFITREECKKDRRIVNYSLNQDQMNEMKKYWEITNAELLQQERKLR